MIAAASDFSNKGSAAVAPVTNMHDVDVEALLELRGRGVGRKRAGIGDEDVKAVQRLGAVGDPGCQRLRVGDVEGSREDPGTPWLPMRGRFRSLGRHCGAQMGDGRALGNKALGDGKPDAAGRSRDEDFAAFQLQIHGNRSL